MNTEQVSQEQLIEWALQNLNQCYVKVAPSKIHGVGLIAMRDIPKDTVIFYFSYRDFPCIEISKKILQEKIPPEVYEQIIQNWAVTAEGVIAPINVNYEMHFVNFLNHSEEGNIRYENECYIATKDIAKGEEILIDYRHEDYNPDGLHF